MSLVNIKRTMPLVASSIYLINADSVMVHYWTHTRMIVYKQTCKNILRTCRLCVDATRSLVKPVYRTEKSLKSSHIFLYPIVLHDKNVESPVY